VKYTNSWGKKAHEEQEDLMCVEHIGSNYVEFGYHTGDSVSGCKAHFDEFFKCCRPEPNWQAIITGKLTEIQKQIREKTQLLITKGRELCLLQQKGPERQEQEETLLPARVTVDPKLHKEELVALRDMLPEVTQEIKVLGPEFASQSKNLSYPDVVKLESVKKALAIVNDRIFTIELYCGLQEQVKQIAQGNPAPMTEPIAIRQQLLFMDEETLFDYEDGGMDFKKLDDFDEWVVKPCNLSRLLPEPRGIVAFKVRRYKKDYGPCETLLDAWTQIDWDEANLVTYLLIRNGENVYRIASSVDFEPRLIPRIDEIGEAQFKETHRAWMSDEVTETFITPNDIEYDQHVEKLDHLIQHYNRIVILIQGLLDRSNVFSPHPVINLRKPESMETWLRLVRDEERALPPTALDWKTYQKQLNSTLKAGKWIYINREYEKNVYHERFDRDGSRRKQWWANRIPKTCKIDRIKKDRTMVYVSWPMGKTRGRYVYSYATDHREWVDETDRMMHDWIPVEYVLNLSDYTLGDYKLFLSHYEVKKDYGSWARYILNAEDWARQRAKGIPPEDDSQNQVRMS
jgi:hypothetical protein